MTETEIALVYMEAKAAAEKTNNYEDRVKAAMTAAMNHWMVLDEQKQFSGAVAAIMELSTEQEQRSMKRELNTTKAINAAASGVPIDFSALFAELEEEKDLPPSKLSATWRDLKKEKK